MRVSGPSPRLLQIGLGFLAITVVGALLWPHLWPTRKAIAEIRQEHFSQPQEPLIPIVAKKVVAVVRPQPAPQASPVKPPKQVCQPCIQAANEVLTRYLKAIRDGAGADEHEGRDTLSLPQIYPQNHPVWSGNSLANVQFPDQH